MIGLTPSCKTSNSLVHGENVVAKDEIGVTYSADHSKYLVDENIVWRNPTNPGEIRQPDEYQPREEVPGARADHDIEEKPYSAGLPTIRYGIFPRMQC